jgi:hypothetical protein
MWLLLLLLCWPAAGSSIVGDNSRNSRFGGFNSRLGAKKFPSSSAPGIGSQGLDLADHCRPRNALRSGIRRNLPVTREKPGFSLTLRFRFA